MTVIDEIAAERARQIAKGYDRAHDDAHANGEIAFAAISYAAPGLVFIRDARANAVIYHDPWPWEVRFDKRAYDGNVVLPNSSLKPSRRRDLLVKAAAMLVAEIQRVDRVAGFGKGLRRPKAVNAVG